MKNIYEEAIKVMKAEDIGNYNSDLHLKVTQESAKLIDEYKFKENVTKFKSSIDGVIWYEVPFAYTPYWMEKVK